MHVIDAERRGSPEGPLTSFEGKEHGAGVSFILVSTDQDGAGPALHQHPYAETFHIRAGEAVFRVGADSFVAHGGQILVVPAWTPHAFTKTGPGRLEMTNVHASDVFITEWLDDPLAP